MVLLNASVHSLGASRRGTIVALSKWFRREQPMNPNQPNPPEPFPRERIPPELLEWARQTFDEEEFLAEVREIEATGGQRLEDFIAELEARARAT
jgi:hypothetical protein